MYSGVIGDDDMTLVDSIYSTDYFYLHIAKFIKSNDGGRNLETYTHSAVCDNPDNLYQQQQ